MAEAEVGDDGYGEDPTVNELEAEFAARLGKEAAVFVPSGTMANQIALRVLGVPGTAVVAGGSQHVVVYENGAAAMNASIQFHPVDDSRGHARARRREARDRSRRTPSGAGQRRVHREHPHGGSGTPWALEAIDAIAALGLPVHLDGARLFNAEVATGVSVARYASAATTVMCCLSKGLGAPVGSLLAGPRDLIDARPGRAQATRRRDAPGRRARRCRVSSRSARTSSGSPRTTIARDVIAEAVASRWPGTIDADAVRTNLVVFRPPDAARSSATSRRTGCSAARSPPASCGSSRTSTSTTTRSASPRRRSPPPP